MSNNIKYNVYLMYFNLYNRNELYNLWELITKSLDGRQMSQHFDNLIWDTFL